jgi:hypothetical protein
MLLGIKRLAVHARSPSCARLPGITTFFEGVSLQKSLQFLWGCWHGSGHISLTNPVGSKCAPPDRRRMGLTGPPAAVRDGTCRHVLCSPLSDKISGMSHESTEQKWNRLSEYIRNLILTECPNPDRIGCPGSAVVSEYARRAADFDETVEPEADYQHIVHCSPCYADFLGAREQLRMPGASGQPKRLPNRVEKGIARALDGIEDLLKSCSR